MPARVTILHTNDLHGRLDTLPRLATLIQRERALARAEGRRVLLLDAGDSSSKKNPESLATHGRANFALLGAMGYQAATLGNRDVKWGAAALRKLVASAPFPVLAANLRDLAPLGNDAARLAVPGLQTHAVPPSGRLGGNAPRVGVIGLTAWAGYDYAPLGYRAVNGVGLLRDLIEQLHGEGVQTIVLLSHLGYPADVRLTSAVAGLTAIVGGHSHARLDPPVAANGIAVAQAGEYGECLGRLDLTLDDRNGRLLEFSGCLLPCGPDVPPDGTVSATLELVQEEAARLARPTQHRMQD